jgi:hypothetical protein
MLLNEQHPNISKDHNFFMLKGPDVPVIWTLMVKDCSALKYRALLTQ